MTCRDEETLSEYGLRQDKLVSRVTTHIEACSNLLESDAKGLSLASTARVLLTRAKSYIRLRELSLGMADLAWAFGLWPCSHEVGILCLVCAG